MRPVNVQSTWMQEHHAINGKTYLEIGKVDGRQKTLLVTLKGGTGGAVMYCEIHKQVYGIVHEVCPDCRNAVREEPAEFGVTACDTP